MQPNDAGDQVKRIDQAFNSLEQLIADQAPPLAFWTAFTQTADQLLPGGHFYWVLWLGKTWLIEPLREDQSEHPSAARVDRTNLRLRLDALKEQTPPSGHMQHKAIDYRQTIYTSGCTFCLAARGSIRAAWGGLIWQRDGELDQALCNAVFQLLSPLTELWESYWRSNHGVMLETMRAGLTQELVAWESVTQADELAFRLVNDLALATGCERCAIVETAQGFRRFQLLAINGLADVKIQSKATIDALKSLSAMPPDQVHRTNEDASLLYLVLKLDARRRVVFQWSDKERCIASLPRLSMLWPTVTQAWHVHPLRPQARSRLAWPRGSSKRWLPATVLLIAGIALWMTRDRQLTLTIDCPGRLEPTEQVWVFAPADGRVEDVLVSDRQLVTQGQALVAVTSPALELQMQSVSSEMETLLQKKLSLDVLASETNTSTEAGNREARRIAGEILELELRIEGLQRQRVQLEEERKKLLVLSQIRGRVVGGDLAQDLKQKPVRTGDYLFRVVNDQSHWYLDLSLPERELGHVEQALHSSAGQLPIRFSIVGMPGKSYEATVTRIRSAVQLDEHQASVVRLMANVASDELPPVPIGTQVLARIETGSKAWWFVVARPAIETLQRRGWLP